MRKYIVYILKNPITLLLSIIIGIYIGSSHKIIGTYLSVYSTIYLLLLNMAVIPVIVSAIICSIGKFITNDYLKRFFGRIILFVGIVSIIYALLGILVGVLFTPGDISTESKDILSQQVNLRSEVVEVNLSGEDTVETGFISFLLKIIPSNIFNSLSSSHIFSILIFSILFGLSIGSLPKRGVRRKYLIIGFFEEIYEVFSTLISYLMVLLPIFVVCITASEFAKMNMNVIFATGKLVLIFYIFGFLLLCANVVMLAVSSKQKLLPSAMASFHPLVALFVVRNSIVTMPIFINTLSSKFKVNYVFSKSVLPILMVIGRFGNIFYFSLITIFSAQLYDIELSGMIYMFLAVAVIFAGLATFGISGTPTLSILAVVISSIGIPVETTLLFLISIDIVIEPLRSTIIMHTNTALTSVLYNNFTKKYQDIR